MFRTDLIAAAAATMIAAAIPTAAIAAKDSKAAVLASVEAGVASQQLTGEVWNGSRWNGVFVDETALSDEAIDAMLAEVRPPKGAA